jgi:hypothetical protein
VIDGFIRVSGVEGSRRKALKGTAETCADKGWLQLRWSWGGKRYFLAIGLPDTQVNRTIAERKAKLIERDILTKQFDQTRQSIKLKHLRGDSARLIESNQIGESLALSAYLVCHLLPQTDFSLKLSSAKWAP